MSAPVTEAHIALSARITRENGYDPESGWNRPHVLRDAQYIADSEAKACAELLQQVANLKYSNHYHRKTAETSRATETDRNNLRADLDAIKSILNEEKARAERAEAELDGIRALADRRNERDHSQDTTHQLVAALDQALDIAQAELAQFRELDAERARMRQIAVDKRIRTPTPRTDEEAGSLIDAEEVVPADFARELERELAKERARLDWLESVMAPDANYCEVFFAGLRNWTGSAHAFQIESNPRTFPTLNAPTVRAAIDAAMKEGA